MFIEEKQLKDFMIDAGLVSRADFETASKEAGEKKVTTGSVLVSLGKIKDDELRRIQAHILGIPFISLSDLKIPFDILSMIPEPIARHHNIIAFKQTVDSLEVAMLDTEDLPAIDFIKKKVNLKILPRL
jgi:hypothetical protein